MSNKPQLPQTGGQYTRDGKGKLTPRPAGKPVKPAPTEQPTSEKE